MCPEHLHWATVAHLSWVSSRVIAFFNFLSPEAGDTDGCFVDMSHVKAQCAISKKCWQHTWLGAAAAQHQERVLCTLWLAQERTKIQNIVSIQCMLLLYRCKVKKIPSRTILSWGLPGFANVLPSKKTTKKTWNFIYYCSPMKVAFNLWEP